VTCTLASLIKMLNEFLPSIARRRFAQGGVRPSSEAEAPWCSAWSSSEAEIRPRGRCGFLGREPFFASDCDHAERVLWFVSLFVCFLLFFERGFSPVIRGPLWLSPTVVPEPLQ
jgi:hypothetical protein